MSKKWFALFLALALTATAFCGCSKKTEEPAATETPAAVEETAATEEAAAEEETPLAWPEVEEMAWVPKFDKTPTEVNFKDDGLVSIVYEGATEDDYNAYAELLEAAEEITVNSNTVIGGQSILSANKKDHKSLPVKVTFSNNKMNIVITYVEKNTAYTKSGA